MVEQTGHLPSGTCWILHKKVGLRARDPAGCHVAPMKPAALRNLRAEPGIKNWPRHWLRRGLDQSPLKGATPAEIYFGKIPAYTLATAPPRGRPGEGATSPPFEIFYLDPERLLPILEAKAA